MTIIPNITYCQMLKTTSAYEC